MRIRGIDFDDGVLGPPPTAWPAPRDAPALLFGGTFDPPHRAHVELSMEARDRVLGDIGWLVIVPAARSPHKPSGPIASDADRVEMLRLATQDVPRCAVWADEIDRDADPSYTVDTLARAASLLPDSTTLRLLIGADQAVAFDRWHRHEKILAFGEPVVLLRDPVLSVEAMRRHIQMSGQDPAAWVSRVVRGLQMPGASTNIRAMLRDGEEPEGLLDPSVLDLIQSRGLYRGGD